MKKRRSGGLKGRILMPMMYLNFDNYYITFRFVYSSSFVKVPFSIFYLVYSLLYS